MAFTLNSQPNYSNFGDKAVVMADVAISEAYAAGGISLPYDTLFGLHDVQFVSAESIGGLDFQFDYANKKMKIFKDSPPAIVYDELQQAALFVPDTAAVTGISTITLNYPAAFIMNVAYAGQNYAMRSTAAVTGANQCCLNSQIAAGVATKMNIYTATIITNGTFTGNATGWTLNTGWTYASNAVNKDADGVGVMIDTTGAPSSSTYYDVFFTISAWQSGTVTPSLGGATGKAVSGNGTFVQRLYTVGTTKFALTPSSTARFTVDNCGAVPVPSARVTYVTQAWKEVYDNLVQDESVTLTTGDVTLGEVVTSTNDRTFAGANNWTNKTIATFDGTTGGYMTLTSDASGQYAVLPEVYATTTVGKRYTLTVTSASLTGSFNIYNAAGTQFIGLINSNATAQTFDFIAQTTGGLRFTSIETVSSVRIDNVSLSSGKMLACMYVDQITATAAALLMVDEDDTTASGEIRLKFNAATAQLNCHSDQNAKVCKITYIRQPNSGILFDRKLSNESGTTAANTAVDGYSITFDYPILLWGYTGQMPVNTGVTQVLVDYSAVPDAGEVVWDYYSTGIRAVPSVTPAAGTYFSAKSNVVGTAAGVWGTISDVVDIRPLEMIAGRNLTVASMRIMLIGH